MRWEGALLPVAEVLGTDRRQDQIHSTRSLPLDENITACSFRTLTIRLRWGEGVSVLRRDEGHDSPTVGWRFSSVFSLPMRAHTHPIHPRLVRPSHDGLSATNPTEKDCQTYASSILPREARLLARCIVC
jgi:hypothetical protein